MKLRLLFAWLTIGFGPLVAQDISPENCRLAADYAKNVSGHSVVVYQNGKILLDEYQNGWTADKPHRLASGTKSFNGVAAMIARQEGIINLDELACNTLTEWKTDSLKSQITIRHLLNFSSGLDPAQAEINSPDVPNKYLFAMNVKMLGKPGAAFRYGPAHLMCFGELMNRKLAARNTNYHDYVIAKIMQPIGLQVGYWSRDKAGNYGLPGGLFLTAREWLKFGQLVLQKGQWDGKQIVPSAALAECFVSSATNPAYGLTFWLNAEKMGFGPRDTPEKQTPADLKVKYSPDIPRDLVYAAGAGRQRMYIVPSRNLVVVRMGEEDKFSDDNFMSLLLFGRMGTAKEAKK